VLSVVVLRGDVGDDVRRGPKTLPSSATSGQWVNCPQLLRDTTIRYHPKRNSGEPREARRQLRTLNDEALRPADRTLALRGASLAVILSPRSARRYLGLFRGVKTVIDHVDHREDRGTSRRSRRPGMTAGSRRAGASVRSAGARAPVVERRQLSSRTRGFPQVRFGWYLIVVSAQQNCGQFNPLAGGRDTAMSSVRVDIVTYVPTQYNH